MSDESRAQPGIRERLLEKTSPEPTSGCWLWTASVDRHGYARISHADTIVRAHRVAYELHNGPIPAGMQIDHLCRVRSCVNPAHLELVTGAENTRRGRSFAAVNGRKTHCIRGHAFTDANTKRSALGRHCRTCSIEGLRQSRAAERGNS